MLRVTRIVGVPVLFAVAGLVGCGRSDAEPQAAAASKAPPAKWSFENVVAASGVDFRHTFGDDQFSKILEDTGSGVALIDFDGDTKLDVFLSSGHWVEGVSDPAFKEKTASGRSRLYRNLGGLKFEDVTDAAGVHEHGFGMGAIVGDYDGDGDEDLYVLNWGANVLYRNDGGKFADVTAACGVAGPERLNGQVKWSVNGLFFDYDRDGDLDLWVSNYLAFDPAFRDPSLPKEYPLRGARVHAGQQSQLYRNDGPGPGGRQRPLHRRHEGGRPRPRREDDGRGRLRLRRRRRPRRLHRASTRWPTRSGANDGGKFVQVAVDAGVALDGSGNPMASIRDGRRLRRRRRLRPLRAEPRRGLPLSQRDGAAGRR